MHVKTRMATFIITKIVKLDCPTLMLRECHHSKLFCKIVAKLLRIFKKSPLQKSGFRQIHNFRNIMPKSL